MKAVQIAWDTMSASFPQTPKTFYTQVREETAAYGIENAGIKELLALIIGPKADIKLCQELASLDPSRLMAMGTKEFVGLGASSNTATRIEAVFRLTKRLESIQCDRRVNSPRETADALAFIANEEQEHFVVLILDTKNNVRKAEVITKGTVNMSLASPREVFKTAVRENATRIIIGHNHPSGYTTPSKEDIETSRRISESGKTLGIELLDSLIVGSSGYCSLKEEGLL